MATCVRCRRPLPADADRCPSCRAYQRSFEWLKARSGWAQLAGYLAGFAAVMLATEGQRLAAAALGAVAAVLLWTARRLYLREQGRA